MRSIASINSQNLRENLLLAVFISTSAHVVAFGLVRAEAGGERVPVAHAREPVHAARLPAREVGGGRAEDLARLEDTGITEDMITDIDGYLARYAEQVPEVDSVSFRDGRLFFVRDQETIRKYLLDYVIQTVLSLAFAIMILFEFRISYKQMRGGKEAGNGEG